MTEQQTVTCRSVCERLVAHYPQTAWYVDGGDIIDSARLALGQPDGDDELRADIKSLTQQLDAANKRAAEMAASSDEWFAKCEEANKRADAKDARLEESKRLAAEWQKRAEEAEATVAQQNALLAKASTKDVTIELGKALQRAEEAELRCADWLLDRLVAALAGQRDGCDEELSRVRFLERSAV